MSDEIIDVVDAEQIGDKLIDVDDITPSTYFDYVKGLKQKIDDEEIQLIIDQALVMIKKCKLTKQTAMAKELAHQVDLALRELEVARKGFDIYVDRKDIEEYIAKVEGKAIKIIELSRYTREIPDEVIDKLEVASELFDEIYIIFTDYTTEVTKKVAKERRDKDPILFGAFHDKDADSKNKIYVENKFFFIADWKEEKCDLTLEEIVRDVKGKSRKDITYKVSTPKDEEEIKKYLKSFSEPIENNTPVSLFDKVKEAVVTPVKKRRGRPKKSSSEE